MGGQSETIDSLSKYCDLIGKIVERWSDARQGEMRPWYRGVSDGSYSLLPGLYRYMHLDEEEIRSEFQLKARPLLRDEPRSEWEWYFLMQHHGLPTRLLDWTTGALLGLYFAVRSNPGEKDAAVWVLDPWALNSFAASLDELILSSEAKAAPYLKPLYRKKSQKKLPRLPIAVVPPYNSARITVQRGTFTVHGHEPRGLEQLFQKRLIKIRIPKKSVLLMRRELRTCGIGEFTVFPDLDGLCREICSIEIEGC